MCLLWTLQGHGSEPEHCSCHGNKSSTVLNALPQVCDVRHNSLTGSVPNFVSPGTRYLNVDSNPLTWVCLPWIISASLMLIGSLAVCTSISEQCCLNLMMSSYAQMLPQGHIRAYADANRFQRSRPQIAARPCRSALPQVAVGAALEVLVMHNIKIAEMPPGQVNAQGQPLPSFLQFSRCVWESLCCPLRPCTPCQRHSSAGPGPLPHGDSKSDD